VLGRFTGVKAGHDMNNRLVRKLAATPSAWRWRTFVDEYAEAV
jgi:UDP-3-O-[3-hydroxymyristoyl] N-acetylglucosamine deacetylase